MQRGIAAALSGLLIGLSGGPALAAGPQDSLLLRFDHDSFFKSYPTVTLTHQLSEAGSVSGSFVDYLSWSSFELDLGYNRSIGSWSVSPGIGTTFGPPRWGLGSDQTGMIARDVVPQLGFYYSSPDWEAELYQGAWIPTGQEDSKTSLWFTQTRWWAAAKRGGFGIGPQLETFGTKDGEGPLRLTHLWIGTHVLKDLPKGSFQLFLGYDTISLDSYLGSPKKAGAAFQATFIYPI